jgi:hypothetical protein
MKNATTFETRREPKAGDPPETVTLGMVGRKTTEGRVRIKVLSGEITVTVKGGPEWTFLKGDRATYVSPTEIQAGRFGTQFILERLPMC